jgi:uncharacterized membrane protein YeiB
MKDKYVWIIYAELALLPLALWALLFVLGLPSEISNPFIIIVIIAVVTLTAHQIIRKAKASHLRSSGKENRKYPE